MFIDLKYVKDWFEMMYEKNDRNSVVINGISIYYYSYSIEEYNHDLEPTIILYGQNNRIVAIVYLKDIKELY